MNQREHRSQHPRFQAEYFIRDYLQEFDRYAAVFQERIICSFANLDEEAQRIEDETYARMGEHVNPEYASPDYGMEEAFHAGVNFYLTTDAVRQGVYNLMIAGLFHMLEQQAQYLATRVFPERPIPPEKNGGLNQLKPMLKEKFGINTEAFECWPKLKELNLVANTVKHGDGRSSEELKLLNPDLFRDLLDPFPHISTLPLRPLAGEGLRLTEDHFKIYKTCIEQFWDELVNALLPIFCPPSNSTPSS